VNHVSVFFPSGARVFAELVTSRTDIERGLMHRPVVPNGTGMLFDMGVVGPHRFWMADTLVSLDMLYIALDQVVVDIARNTRPLDRGLYGAGVMSRYVLEVPGGWCARNGVTVGQRVTVVRLPG
jgi:uncharacterized protein